MKNFFKKSIVLVFSVFSVFSNVFATDKSTGAENIEKEAVISETTDWKNGNFYFACGVFDIIKRENRVSIIEKDSGIKVSYENLGYDTMMVIGDCEYLNIFCKDAVDLNFLGYFKNLKGVTLDFYGCLDASLAEGKHPKMDGIHIHGRIGMLDGATIKKLLDISKNGIFLYSYNVKILASDADDVITYLPIFAQGYSCVNNVIATIGNFGK